MTYEFGFVDAALKEWRKLDQNTRDQLKKKLEERLSNPHIPSARLSGRENRYKIKLRSLGYRLVYEVREETSVLVVLGCRQARAERGLSGGGAEVTRVFDLSDERLPPYCTR